MLRRRVILNLRPKVSAHCTLKYFHHKAKKRPSKGSIPASFRLLIANESVLSLNFDKLNDNSAIAEMHKRNWLPRL